MNLNISHIMQDLLALTVCKAHTLNWPKLIGLEIHSLTFLVQLVNTVKSVLSISHHSKFGGKELQPNLVVHLPVLGIHFHSI